MLPVECLSCKHCLDDDEALYCELGYQGLPFISAAGDTDPVAHTDSVSVVPPFCTCGGVLLVFPRRNYFMEVM